MKASGWITVDSNTQARVCRNGLCVVVTISWGTGADAAWAELAVRMQLLQLPQEICAGSPLPSQRQIRACTGILDHLERKCGFAQEHWKLKKHWCWEQKASEKMVLRFIQDESWTWDGPTRTQSKWKYDWNGHKITVHQASWALKLAGDKLWGKAAVIKECILNRRKRGGNQCYTVKKLNIWLQHFLPSRLFISNVNGYYLNSR